MIDICIYDMCVRSIDDNTSYTLFNMYDMIYRYSYVSRHIYNLDNMQHIDAFIYIPILALSIYDVYVVLHFFIHTRVVVIY